MHVNSKHLGPPMTAKEEETTTLQIQISADLYRAFQRCTWLLVNEEGRDRQDIMTELIHDFLIKHGC